MSRTHTWVDYLDIFWLNIFIFRPDLFQLSLDGILLFGFIKIIFPVGIIGLSVTLSPKPSKGIFHHITHYPVGRKKLGSRWDSLCRDLDILL